MEVKGFGSGVMVVRRIERSVSRRKGSDWKSMVIGALASCASSLRESTCQHARGEARAEGAQGQDVRTELRRMPHRDLEVAGAGE